MTEDDCGKSDCGCDGAEPVVVDGSVRRWRQSTISRDSAGQDGPIPNMQAIIAAAEAERRCSSQRTSKFAAVLFDRRTGEILGVAANRFASGISMTDEEMRADRDLKDKSIGHAEERLLDNFARQVLSGEAEPVKPENLGLYATNFCCPRCARKISQQGIGTFVSTTNSLDINERFAMNWAADIVRGKEILDKREEMLGGPVETHLVSLSPDPDHALEGKFRWADPDFDHFKAVEEQAARLKSGEAQYKPPAAPIGPPANDPKAKDDPGASGGPSKRQAP